MGSRAAGPTLKALLSWLRLGRIVLRLLGIPAVLLALRLELFPAAGAPATSAHRHSRHLRRLSLTRTLTTTEHDRGMNSKISFMGGADSLETAQSHDTVAPKRSMALHNNERASGGSPTSSQHHHSAPISTTDASDAASSTSTLSHSSSNPPMPAHARSMSHADVLKQGKRLSLQFPIQPASGATSPGFSPRSRPQSWVAASSPAASPDIASSPTEGNILAFIAAQERYVLELKEELVQAEQDLKSLKQHWATHESVKQRNDMRKITQLQPLNTSLANTRVEADDEDGSTTWMQKEMDRRKALLNGTKTSQRKVFSGSRHLRTLSLLSPDKSYNPSFPQPTDLDEQEDPAKRLHMPPMSRTSTSPDIANQIVKNVNGERYEIGGLSGMQREALVRTGKQMASDFKDGLLTFIEDIRQATVGDEALIGADGSGTTSGRASSTKNSRKPSDGRPALNRSTSSTKSRSAKIGDVGDDFWKAHGLTEPKTGPTPKKKHTTKPSRTPQKQLQEDDFEESWDNWDTPNEKYIAKTVPDSSDDSDEATSPVSNRSSTRTSTRYHSQRHDSKASSLTNTSSAGPGEDAAARDAKRNSIPWPDLVKLSPGNLKRTASHLMKEWEKNLTPPPEARDGSHSSGDYIGRSASPAGLP